MSEDWCPTCGATFIQSEGHNCRFKRPPIKAARDDFAPAALDAEAASQSGLRNLVTSGMEAHYEAIKAADAAEDEQVRALAVREDEARTRAMIATVLQVEMHGIRQAIHDMTHDIQANSAIVKTMDVPLEQVHQSHERAAISFENLQKDMDKLGNRLAGVEQVIDTAGLKKAQDGAEARFTRMLAVMERLVGEIVRLHGETLERARVELERNEARRANIHIPQKPHPKRKHR